MVSTALWLLLVFLNTPWVLALMLGLLLVPTSIYLYCDYIAFLSLGPGGTPQTPFGYLKIKILGLFALRDPYRLIIDTKEAGCLHKLEDRGIRPDVRGIAPHRQITQRASNELYHKLNEALWTMSLSYSDLKIDTSRIKKHDNALFTTRCDSKAYYGEICHIHKYDGSMHLTLHPADMQIVLDSRWGERHPLATGGYLRSFVSEDFVMIYSPRSVEDINTLMQIVSASIWYVCDTPKHNSLE